MANKKNWVRRMFDRKLDPAARPGLGLERLDDRLTPTQLTYGLFDTGVDSTGAIQSSGTDPNYTLAGSPPQGTAGANATILAKSVPSIGTAYINPTGVSASPLGVYEYQTTFTVPAGTNLTAATLTGLTSGSSNDSINQIQLNSTVTPESISGNSAGGVAFTLNGLQIGSNTLTFSVTHTLAGLTDFKAADLVLNLAPAASQQPPTITGSGSTTHPVVGGPAVAVDPGVTIGNPSGANLTTASVSIDTNFTAGDALALPAPVGNITGSYSSATGILTLTGSDTAANYQAALQSVTLQVTAAGAGPRSISFSIAPGQYDAANGHFYQFVSAPSINWGAAEAAASDSSIFGLQGYLATPRNAAEDTFAFSKVGANQAWLGMSDSFLEDYWQRATGPDAGFYFFQGNSGGGGTAQNGAYTNWNTGEPNNSGGNEDYSEFLASGLWNDYNQTTAVAGYIVEFGGSPNDPTLQVTSEAAADPVTTPTLTGISPSSVTAGAGATTVTLTGTQFVPGATTVNFGGTPITPATVSADGTTLTFVVPASAEATAGTTGVTVTTPAGTSGAQTFTVNNPVPTLTGISPTTVPADSPDTTVTLTGTNFVAGSTVTVNGTALPAGSVTYISPTELTAVVPAGDLTTAGTNPSITVTDPGPGGGTTAAQTLTVGPAVAIDQTTLPAPTKGQTYSQTLTAQNGTAPYTFAVTSGTLPAGLTLDPTTGVISGTPTTDETSNFQVTATDANGAAGSQSYALTVSDPLTVTTTSIAPMSDGQAYSQAIATTGGRGPDTFAVTSGALPAGLTLDPTTGVISGTPTTDGPYTFQVTATDADNRTAVSPTYTGSVTEPLAVTTTSIAPVSTGQPYSQTIATTGGQGPDTFAVTSGALPAGLTLDPTTGVISGTPTTNGPFSFAVTATDSAGRTAASPTYTGTETDPLAVTTTSIAPVTNGTPYSQAIATTGGRGPDTFAVTSGALPAGLTLDPTTGVISGTPTTDGPYTFQVTATDADNRTAVSPTYTGSVTEPLAVTTTSIAPVSTGQPYSQTIATTGGQGPDTFAVTSGTLPAGLTLDPTTGVISGTPTTNGPFSFAVTATDSAGRTAASPTYTGTETDPLTVTTRTIAPVSDGQPYSQTIATTGGQGPDTFAVTSGTLPAGLTLDPTTGVVSGTPTTDGPFSFAVTATDSAGRTAVSPTYTGAETEPLAVTTTSIAPVSTGVPYSQTIATTGGQRPDTFAVTSGALPAGLTLNPTTGVISGTPTTNGPFSFAVTATDSAGRTAVSPTYTGTETEPLAVTTTSIAPVSTGAPYSQAIATTGGQGPDTFAVTSGALPAGLTLDPTTGVISGTPTTNGPYSFQVTATDSVGRTAASPTFAGTVTAPLAVTTTSVAPASTGVPYSQTIATTGGQGPDTFAVTSGALPAGLTLDPTTGVISGTPTTDGPFSFTVTATDAAGRTAVSPALTGTVTAPLAVGPAALPVVTTGQPLSQTIAATGGQGPDTFAVTAGDLPAGLTLNPTTGVVSGTPTAAGPYSFTVTATDADGRTATQKYAGTVSDPLAIGTTALPVATDGTAYSQTIATTGGRGPDTFAVTSGTLPAGLTLDPTTGVVSGTPTAAGPYSFTVTATDADDRTAVQVFTGTVANPITFGGSGALPDGTAGATYTQSVAATGGTAPLAYAVSAGALPRGSRSTRTPGP
ncbi:beta strand repeat-containing protein [Fimbriiglobus ruber]|uniref:Fibronectin type III domain protein n=1 Tax=Fimbriiglobus ruber TaxID=1908690 RepID=A0A225E1B6_9BACT|nr:putative Ig domain-containing protein [Fimbriiglobus ruber]OWK47361.1 Fibronectin type III domain protein [Fimbriiglobus ruber]